MKIVLMLLCLFLCSCVKTDIVYGNGAVVTVTDTLEEFNGSVILDLECDMTIDSGDAMVSVTMDENLHRYISIDTAGGKIHIYKNEEYELTKTDLSIRISLPALSDLSMYQGRLISNLILRDSANLALYGTSFFRGEISDPVATISLNDQCQSEIRGSITECELSITSSEVNILDSLLTYKTTVNIDRDVDTKLHVFNELHGILGGSADLLISTVPVVTTIKTTGSGKVKYSVDSDESIIPVE